MSNNPVKTMMELALLLVVISLVCTSAFKFAQWLWLGFVGGLVGALAFIVGLHQLWHGDKRD